MLVQRTPVFAAGKSLGYGWAKQWERRVAGAGQGPARTAARSQPRGTSSGGEEADDETLEPPPAAAPAAGGATAAVLEEDYF